MTPIPATHADHDPLAIAAHAAGDATGSELDTALALVAGCEACALLHHDLRSIATALPALPAPVRSRDFRITPQQAASLRPSGLRRLLAPLAGPRFAFAGPLGTGLATLGIAGLLVGAAAGMPISGSGATAASAPQDTAAGTAAVTSAGTAAGAGNSGASEYAAAAPSDAQEKAPDGAPLAAASLAPELTPVVSERARTADASGVPIAPLPGDQQPGGFVTTNAGPAESAAAESRATEPAQLPAPAGNGSVPVLPLVSGLALVVGLGLAGLRVAGRRLVAA